VVFKILEMKQQRTVTSEKRRIRRALQFPWLTIPRVSRAVQRGEIKAEPSRLPVMREWS
jgi:hypothetical protein